jgi:hypothetical protein
MKHPLVMGLISHLMAITLQGDIAQIIGRLVVSRLHRFRNYPRHRVVHGSLAWGFQRRPASLKREGTAAATSSGSAKPLCLHKLWTSQISKQKLEEIRAGIRELGLNGDVKL